MESIPGRAESLAVSPVEMIQIKRRNERPHTSEEIASFIAAYTQGHVPEYQMSAWLMAICIHHDVYRKKSFHRSRSEVSEMPCRPAMTLEETAALTRAMVDSGKQLQWPQYPERHRLVGKHSTGGVGDKVSILLAPLVASFGIGVPMMAGRGLGHTGGTIDKLESIPGFRCDLTAAEFQEQMLQKEIGCAITSTTPEVCPADRKLYALRDVTDTVACPALQTASILSKKIAEHPDSLVLDVKYGSGAFQATVDDAVALAESMVHAGEANGLTPTVAFVTNMDAPLGECIGNWYEVEECHDILRCCWNERQKDLILVALVLAGQMICQAGRSVTLDEGMEQALTMLRSQRPLQRFYALVHAQGGQWLDQPSRNNASIGCSVKATRSGYIRRIDAGYLGRRCALFLGAGRSVAGAPVDPFAGIRLHIRVGQYVDCDRDVLMDVYSSSISLVDLETEPWEDAVEYSEEPILDLPPIITHRITAIDGVTHYSIPHGLRNSIDACFQ